MQSRMRRTKPVNPNRKEPRTPREWTALMNLCIARARELNDRRLPGLLRAIELNKVAATLKRMGIICSADIDREFSSPAQ